MQRYRNILSIGLLVVALAWTLWFVFAGFGNHQDPLYWLYKYEHLEGGWMAVGTLLTGGTIVRLFGAQLLPLRLFGWLCTVVAVALPYCFLLNKEQRRGNLHWLALAYLLMGYGAFQEFSPGTLTVLLLSAIWVCAVKLPITKNEVNRALAAENDKLPILTALLAGLAVSVRFPNILVLLVLIPLWKKRSLWNIPIAALTAGVVYLLGYWLVTPAPLDAAMTSHEISSMLSKLWSNGGLLVGFLLLGIGVLAIGDKSVHRTPYTIHHTPYIGVAVGLALVYFIAYAIKPLQWYNTDLTYLIAALCLVIACTSYTVHRTPYTLPIGAAILIVATLGTDTAWLKLFPAVLCLLPVAGAQQEEGMRKYLWWVLLPVAIIVMAHLTKVETLSTTAPYCGIAITYDEEARLQQYKADYDSLSSVHRTPYTVHSTPSTILALGQENHLMRAVTGCEAAKYNEFWSNIFDSVYTAKYSTVIDEERPVVFCAFSPQFKTKVVYKDKESRMECMLRDKGYRAIDRSAYKYMIYIPDYDEEIQ